MAAFTDQFSRQSPFEFIASDEYHRDLHEISNEVSKLLEGRSVDWLACVAKQIDLAIEGAVSNRRFTAPGPWQDLIADGRFKNIPPVFQRLLYGEFRFLRDLDEIHNWELDPIPTRRWERFAVFSLWMLADAIRVDQRRNIPDSEKDRTELLMRGDVTMLKYMIASIRSLQIAQSIKVEEQLLSTRNRKNGILANPNAEANRLRALEMAEELPFRSMNKAAEHIADNLVKGTTKAGKETFYSTDWIKAWLREAAWTPRHKRKPPL